MLVNDIRSRKSEKFIPNFSIHIGGKEQTEMVGDLISIDVDDSICEPSMFSLVLADEKGTWLDCPQLNPEIGKDMKICLGYADGERYPLITGKVVALSPDFHSEEARTLAIQGYDHSFFLQKTHSLENPIALKGQDISMLAKEIARRNKLIPKISNTGIKYSDIVLIAPGESDYSFLRRMADMAGFEFFVRDRTLYFRRPNFSAKIATLSWGKDIFSMNFRVSTARVVKKAIVRGYNPVDKKSFAFNGSKVGSGTFSGISAPEYVANSEFQSQILEQNMILSSQKDMDILGEALMDRTSSSFVEGKCEMSGDPKIRAGVSLEIKGAGKRLNGSYYIKSAKHSIGEDGYRLNLDLMSMVIQEIREI